MKKIILSIFILILCKLSIGQQPVFMKFYYLDSTVSSEGWMRDDKPDLYWKSYYPNGVLRSEGNRKNFQLDSLWIFYSEDGSIEMSVNYQDGKKHGIRKIYTNQGVIENEFYYDTIQNFENHYDTSSRLLMQIPYEKGLPHGIAKEYDTLGNIISITEYNKGYISKREYINRVDYANRKQGSWKCFWENGNLQLEGYYVNDKRNGFFKYYDEEGVFRQIEKWQNGELVEDAIETKRLEKKTAFYPNGQIKTEAFYYRGKPEGIRREYDSNGVIVHAYTFKNACLIGEGIVDENGWKQGDWKEFYEEYASLKAKGKYKNNKPIGKWEYYFPDSSVEITGYFNNRGEKEGEWIWYYPNRKVLMIENYEDGLYEGLVISFDEKGDTVFVGTYSEGLENGRFIYINEGVLNKYSYLQGEKFGKWQTFYSNGKLKEVFYFENDFQEGKAIFYWENGRKKAEYNYINGLLDGNAYTYDEEGNLLFTTTYNMGIETAYGGVKVTPVLDK